MDSLSIKIEELNKEIAGLEGDNYRQIHSFGGVLLYNKGRIVELNEQMVLMLGYESREELLGNYVKDIFTLESYNLAVKNIVFDHERINELDCVKKDGRRIRCKICSKLVNHNGNTIGIITGRKIKLPAIGDLPVKIQQDKYASLFDNSLDGIFMIDLDGRYIDANPALIKILGFTEKEQLLSKKAPAVFYSQNDKRISIKNNFTREAVITRTDGREINAEINSTVIYERTRPAYIQGIVRDISERKKAEEKIRFLSFHDSLTGLYNRAFFEEQIKRLDVKRQLPLSIIIGDVNGLKLVNDTFGHREGDLILTRCASILKKCCRSEDLVFRLGGDEFIILLPQIDEENTIKIINRIKDYCQGTDGNRIPISISLGYTIKMDTDEDIEVLLKDAEDMMYTNKLMESKSISSSIFSSLRSTLYEKSIETENHAERLKELALKLGTSLGLANRKLDELVLLAALHDIGKIAIPESILMKKEKLEPHEWEQIKKHPESGYRIVLSSPQLSPISKGVLYHHEWWDGSGYPEGLAGEDIPITSRIISIVDAYDVMLNGRPYKKPMNKRKAINELKRFSGRQFDPELVRRFIMIVNG